MLCIHPLQLKQLGNEHGREMDLKVSLWPNVPKIYGLADDTRVSDLKAGACVNNGHFTLLDWPPRNAPTIYRFTMASAYFRLANSELELLFHCPRCIYEES